MVRGGGVQECILALQSELTKRGHRVKIITPTPPSDRPLPNKAFTLYVGGGTDFKSFHTTTQISAAANPELLDDLLVREAFDVLHFHEPWVPLLSRQLLSRSRAVNIATFHAKLPETVMTRTIEKVITPYTRSVLKYLNGLTAVSDPAAEYIHSLTRKQVQIIPNGINLDHYQPVTGSKRRPYILYIGRLEKRKGVKYLLRAYKRFVVQHPGVALKIVGAGPEQERLEEYVERHHLTSVEFLGRVSDKKKIRLLREALLFCSPALFGESFGIVLLEAMATGTVLLAGNNSGYASVLQEKSALALVNPKDTAEFARKLEQLCFDEDVRTMWQRWATKHVKQFSYESIVNQYEKFYKQALAAVK